MRIVACKAQISKTHITLMAVMLFVGILAIANSCMVASKELRLNLYPIEAERIREIEQQIQEQMYIRGMVIVNLKSGIEEVRSDRSLLRGIAQMEYEDWHIIKDNTITQPYIIYKYNRKVEAYIYIAESDIASYVYVIKAK